MDSRVRPAVDEEALNVAGVCAELCGLLLVVSAAFSWLWSTRAAAARARRADRRVLVARVVTELQEEHGEQLRALMAEHEATERSLRRSIAKLERRVANLESPVRKTARARRQSEPTGPPGASPVASEEAAMGRTTGSGSLSESARRAADNDSSPPSCSPQASGPTPDGGPRARNTRAASSARMEANARVDPPTPMRTRHDLLPSIAELERREVENACRDAPRRTTSRSAPTAPPRASTSAAASEEAAMRRTTDSGSLFHRQVVARLLQVAESARMPASAADDDRPSPPSPQQASGLTPNSGPRAQNTRSALSALMEANDCLAPPTPMPDRRWTRRHDPSSRPIATL